MKKNVPGSSHINITVDSGQWDGISAPDDEGYQTVTSKPGFDGWNGGRLWLEADPPQEEST